MKRHSDTAFEDCVEPGRVLTSGFEAIEDSDFDLLHKPNQIVNGFCFLSNDQAAALVKRKLNSFE